MTAADPGPRRAVDAAVEALNAPAGPERAAPMAAYMKDIAPILGVRAEARRQALRRAWKRLPTPTSAELGEAAHALMALDERQFHYAAYDRIDRELDVAADDLLAEHVEVLLTTGGTPSTAWAPRS